MRYIGEKEGINMLKLPMTFEVEARSAGGIATPWTAQSNKFPPIPSSIPPEFMGPGTGYSPEDLFGIAVLNCLIATFKVYCEKAKVTFSEIKGKALVKVNKEPSLVTLHISHIEIFFDVMGSSDPKKARELLDGAIKDCAISNSIKSCKLFHINVS